MTDSAANEALVLNPNLHHQTGMVAADGDIVEVSPSSSGHPMFTVPGRG